MTMPPFQTWTVLLFGIGLLMGVVGWVWFLFASYRADPCLARWAKFLPMLAIRVAIEHRETCLRPFILLHVGGLLCVPHVLRILAGISLVERQVLGS